MLWASQPYRPEVWIEKDALTGVIEDVEQPARLTSRVAATFRCRKCTLPANASPDCGPRPSSGRPASRRPRSERRRHDPRHPRAAQDACPSGNRGRGRIALNLGQVTGLPPNFAKENDSRYAAYVRQFGTTDCWELDALAPNVISGLVRDELDRLIDRDTWARAIAAEDDNRAILAAAADTWSLVKSARGRLP